MHDKQIKHASIKTSIWILIMTSPKKIIVTGGAGYIGSAICSFLQDNGITPIVLDSLVTGNKDFIRDFPFYQNDISEPGIISRIRKEHPEAIALIHCAARIIVEESVKDPELYYRENVLKSLELFKQCGEAGITSIVFSSSASVYGESESQLVSEDAPLNPQSPYAKTKAMMEQILEDFSKVYNFNALSLRYFNPIGSDPSLRTGAFVKNPTHILGTLQKCARDGTSFKVFGTNYPTRDGTGVRDYIHVWDLAAAHLQAVNYLIGNPDICHDVINLGTSKGTTVKEFVSAFESVSQKSITAETAQPRAGDVAGVYASNEKAKKLLGWLPEFSIETGIRDSLSWEKKFLG